VLGLRGMLVKILQEEFVKELKRLHVAAGKPSYARLSRSCGIPASTIGDLFGAKFVHAPPWETVRAVVQACVAEAERDDHGAVPTEVASRGDVHWWRRRHGELMDALAGTTSNNVDGNASSVVQAGVVNGDVISHGGGRPFIELYQKALDHIDSGRAHTRMAGLRTLSELGQDHPNRRQAVVDIFCSYLRTPADEDDRAELEVRRTLQDILANHLRPLYDQVGAPQNATFWKGINVNLSEATLRELRFDYCEFARANFEKACFIGSTGFRGTRFLGEARFVQAVFDGWWADFEDAQFENITWFRWADFKVNTLFSRAKFSRNAEFSRATFHQDAHFSNFQVAESAWFTHIIFHKDVDFHNAHFNYTNFWFVDFEGNVDFRGAQFQTGQISYIDLRREDTSTGAVTQHWPPGFEVDSFELLPPRDERTLPSWW
jgi:uncharacterized protein YjbI with pentapeptide repeats